MREPWRIILSGLVILFLAALLMLMHELPKQFSPSPTAARSAPAPSGEAGLAARTPPGGGTIALIGDPQPVYGAPGGRAVGTLAARTQFGSPAVFPVVARSGPWLGVLATQLRNNHIGWIQASHAQVAHDDYSIRVQTASHRLAVFYDGRLLRTLPVAVGLPAAPTPTGRFGVTDKIHFNPASAAYGCCALGLSAHEYHLLPGWTGGDLVAIHSTPDSSSIGRSLSHGCVRASLSQGRWLADHIPLGTLVTIRAS